MRGSEGEDAARAHAEARGLRLLARNVRTPYGELDLVLEDRAGTLVFGEVKARSGRGFGAGLDAITARQRERIRRAGVACAGALGKADAAMRFDVFAVAADGSVEHFPDVM